MTTKASDSKLNRIAAKLKIPPNQVEGWKLELTAYSNRRIRYRDSGSKRRKYQVYS